MVTDAPELMVRLVIPGSAEVIFGYLAAPLGISAASALPGTPVSQLDEVVQLVLVFPVHVRVAAHAEL